MIITQTCNCWSADAAARLRRYVVWHSCLTGRLLVNGLLTHADDEPGAKHTPAGGATACLACMTVLSRGHQPTHACPMNADCARQCHNYCQI